jgi:hypothetical protein
MLQASSLLCSYSTATIAIADPAKNSDARPERFFLLIKIISTRYLLIFLITRKYLVDMILINPFRSGVPEMISF